MKPEQAHFVFVYGVSRRGGSMSCDPLGKFLCAAAVRGYWLYELSALGRSYAMVAHADRPPPAPLSGELFAFDAAGLAEMDRTHDVASGLYERVLVEVCLEDGEVQQAWLYEGAKIAPTRVESGDWAHRGLECGKA